ASSLPAMRTIGVASLAICAIALGVYALAPAQDSDAIELHRPVQAKHTKAASADPTIATTQSAEAAATQPAVAAPMPTVNAAYASAMAGKPFIAQGAAAAPGTAVTQPTTAAAVPAARSVPTTSPY